MAKFEKGNIPWNKGRTVTIGMATLTISAPSAVWQSLVDCLPIIKRFQEDNRVAKRLLEAINKHLSPDQPKPEEETT